MVCKTQRGVVSDGENLGPTDDSAVFHPGPGAARTAVWRRAVMASRRVLLLVGPCRVDGGEAAATGDLGGLEDVDKARRTRRSFSRENGHPHQRDRPSPRPSSFPHRRRSTRSTRPRDWQRRSIACARRARRPVTTEDGPTSASAHVDGCACCSWWPDVGAIGYADGARSDQRWIEERASATRSRRWRQGVQVHPRHGRRRRRAHGDHPGGGCGESPELIRQSEPAGGSSSAWCGSQPASGPTEARDP